MGLLRTANTSTAEGRHYRPRMGATLTVPIAGSRQERIDDEGKSSVKVLQVRPKSVRIERNDHNQADTCSLTLDWTEAGVDARMLDDATVEVHICCADSRGLWTPSERTCRFVGIVKEVDSSRPSEDAAEVTLQCTDYTSLFLTAKPFGSDGIPELSQSLASAWLTIVSQVPGAESFLDQLALVCQDVNPNIIIGSGVDVRFRNLGQVQTKPDTDAWAVWQQCVGMRGLLSYIDKDKCVVTTASNYYTEHDAPKLLWGQNIKTWHESRISALAKKGIQLTSFNPLTLRTIEALWPPLNDPLVKRKRASSKKVQSAEKLLAREERDYFNFPGVTDVGVLLDVARRVYEERSRQELEGTIQTHEMWVQTEQDLTFDLLDLRAGETVRVEVDTKQRQLLSALPSDLDRINWLKERGYSEDVADLIVANMKNFAGLEARFLTKRVAIDLEVDETSGAFAIDIDYVNRIQIDGSAK